MKRKFTLFLILSSFSISFSSDVMAQEDNLRTKLGEIIDVKYNFNKNLIDVLFGDIKFIKGSEIDREWDVDLRGDILHNNIDVLKEGITSIGFTRYGTMKSESEGRVKIWSIYQHSDVPYALGLCPGEHMAAFQQR